MSTVYISQLDAFTFHHKARAQNDTASTSSRVSSSPLLESLAHALSGSTGAALSNIATYPLDLIITRLQIQRQLRKHASQANENEYKGVSDACTKIYEKEGGWSAFFQGVQADTVKTVADSFLFFLFYSFLRERRMRRSRGELSALEELGVGFVAGAVTKAATTPVANVVTRMQVGAMTGAEERGGMDVMREVVREKGWKGLWSGYSASLVLTLNPSLTFFLFEMLKRVSLRREAREKPSAMVTFFLSAVSKSVASSVTYPFSLAKSRLQVGGKRERSQEEDELNKDVGDAKERKVMQDTIFGTLFTIVEREGWTSLYEGLELEVVKGFLSHGITMVIKQAIQRLLIKLWYFTGIVLRRYRRKLSGKNMKRRAQENVEYYNLGMARAADKIEGAVQQAQQSVRQRAYETAEFVGDYVSEDSETWKDLYGPVGLSKWLAGDRGPPK